MKFRLISLLMAGLLSFGAMAQVPPVTTNPPLTAAPASVLPRGIPGPASTNPPAVVSPTNAVPANAAPVEPPDKGQFSRALGIYYSQGVGRDLIGQFGVEAKTDLDMGIFLEMFSNSIVGVPITMSNEDLTKLMAQQRTYRTNQIDIETNKLMTTGPENRDKGEKFMDSIAATPGVTKLTSGVVYKVIKEGDGAKPTVTDMVTMTFRTSLVDDTEVWKAEHARASVTDPLLPPGIKEVLLMMKAGSHWMVYLPYHQAFGEKLGIRDAKHGFKVGPYSALVFDLEVESVQPAPPPPPPRGGMPPPRGAMPPSMVPTTNTGPTVRMVPTTNTGSAITTVAPVTTSPIVRVPSAAEMERGDKPRVLTEEEVEAAKRAQTNAPSTSTNSGGTK